MDKKLYMYFPENDLALAAATPSYTAPAAALRLHRAGEALPIWEARPGDRFVCSGINARWLGQTLEAFGIEDVDVYDHHATDLEAAPWGWSAASRHAMAAAGYPMELMPDDDALEFLRALSHRRTSIRLAEAVAAALPFAVTEAATEAADTDHVREYLAMHGHVIAKAPWSSSGRGIVRSRNMPADVFLRQAEGIIRRQGSVLLEQEWDKALDFALLFEADGQGKVERRGVSVFDTTPHGGYCANVLADQDTLTARVATLAGRERFEAVAEAVAGALPAIIGPYRGPLGVDMLVCADGTIDAAVELNLRRTMGFVALGFARYLAPGAQGRLIVTAEPTLPPAPAVTDSCGRLAGGVFDLTPPDPHFAFRAVIDTPQTH